MTTVIICTYNRAGQLIHTLNSLAQITTTPGSSWELIVVDNNSKDRTADVIREFAATASFPVRYVFESKQGLSHARNAGIAAAQGDIIVFTDDDVLVEKTWLAELLQVFDEYPCAAVCGRVVATWDFPKPRWCHDDLWPIVSFNLGDKTKVIRQFGIGANMAFRKSAFTEFGVFRTDLGRKEGVLICGEDVDIFRRLINANQQVVYVGAAIVYHPVTPDRARKDYCRKWYIGYGMSTTRLEGLRSSARSYFGAPDYLWRDGVKHFVKWMITTDPAQRFLYQMQVYLAAGAIREARRGPDEEQNRGRQLSAV